MRRFTTPRSRAARGQSRRDSSSAARARSARWISWPSIAVDGSGTPRIAYEYRAAGALASDLRIARKPGATWIVETVDGGADAVGSHASIAIALDAAGKVHVTYYDSLAQELRHAYKGGGAWNVEVVDATGTQSGLWSSLALDADDNAHTSYYSLTADEVRYATVDLVTAVDSWSAGRGAAARPALFVYPNPAVGGRVDVRFEMGLSQGVGAAVELFDVAGRCVRAMALEPRSGATLAARWDGRDDSGRDVAPGVYFLRVAADRAGRESRARVTVVR